MRSCYESSLPFGFDRLGEQSLHRHSSAPSSKLSYQSIAPHGPQPNVVPARERKIARGAEQTTALSRLVELRTKPIRGRDCRGRPSGLLSCYARTRFDAIIMSKAVSAIQRTCTCTAYCWISRPTVWRSSEDGSVSASHCEPLRCAQRRDGSLHAVSGRNAGLVFRGCDWRCAIPHMRQSPHKSDEEGT